MGRAIEKTIEEYKTISGKSPLGEWFDALADKRTQALIFTRLDRLKIGLLGAVRNVGEGVHEIKIDCGPGYRIYFGNDGEWLVMLLAGGTKKPRHQIYRRPSFIGTIIKIRKMWGGKNMSKNKLTTSYQDHLISKLSDPELASEYLNMVIDEVKNDAPEDVQSLLLIAIKNVVQAQGGISQLAESVGLSRQSIHHMLSEKGNPTLSSLINILEASGIKINFQPGKKKAV